MEVTVRKPVSIPLVLQYYVAGPIWEPRHVARYDSNAGKIVLETYAWVSQDTGEAWSEVKLKVSTVRSLRGLIPPIPSPLELRLEKSKTHIAGQENQLQELPSRGYRLQGGDSRSFDIDGKVSIEFGKNGKKVLLKSRILKAIPERIATPAASPEVYLNLTIQNSDLIPFLPGKTSLFNGSDYIGTSQMPRLLPGELLIIPFGQDSSVRVERILTERSQTKKKRKQSIRVNYNFKATNLKKQPIVVKVRDRSPHTKNKAVKIKLDNSKIPVRKRQKTDPRGQVTWIVEVPGSGQKLWNFSYTIIVPQGKRLVGLD